MRSFLNHFYQIFFRFDSIVEPLICFQNTVHFRTVYSIMIYSFDFLLVQNTNNTFFFGITLHFAIRLTNKMEDIKF